MKLCELKNGEEAYICSVDAHPSLKNRMADLGLLPGERVQRLYASSLGSPVVYIVMGQTVALRHDEAAAVETSAEPQGEAPHAAGGMPEDVPAATGGPGDVYGDACGVGCTSCGSHSCPSCARRREGRRREGEVTLALVGNPNCGKTAFFNAACGGHERTGNYAGVTVTSTVGQTTFEGTPLRVVDLPGTYSLHSYSPDEAFVMHELARGDVDAIVNIVDVNHLERNLLLTLQLLRMGRPVVCVLNMYDEFLKNGSTIDVPALEKRLGVPCITTVARRGDGVGDALRAALQAVRQAAPPQVPETALCGAGTEARHWAAKRLVEGIVHTAPVGDGGRATRRIDRFLAHGPLALPVFALVMVAVFYLTFELGAYPMDLIDAGVGVLSEYLGGVLPEGGVRDLLVDGIVGGVGSVIVFLPNILILYLCISLLEDSGYLARAALLADPLLARVGLHGKSFIPMLMGFGCNVPAVMATRTIGNRRTRLLTMLAVPFMSCSARLPVYVVFCGAFFPDQAVWVMSSLYFGGIAVALLLSWLMARLGRRRGENAFVMEIPPYRCPQASDVLRHTWERGRQYLRKMGGVILVASVLIWTLGYFPRGTEEMSPAEQQEQSYLGKIGHAMEPVFAPLGFDWRMNVGILAGTGAKELMVSTLGVLYSCEEGDAEAETAGEASGTRLAQVLRAGHSAPTAMAYMVFALFYFPCFATVVAIATESGRRRMALYTALYTTAVAYLMALLVCTLMALC